MLKDAHEMMSSGEIQAADGSGDPAVYSSDVKEMHDRRSGAKSGGKYTRSDSSICESLFRPTGDAGEL